VTIIELPSGTFSLTIRCRPVARPLLKNDKPKSGAGWDYESFGTNTHLLPQSLHQTHQSTNLSRSDLRTELRGFFGTRRTTDAI
jgi:hypothetical protein